VPRPRKPASHAYHHGDLRRALLDEGLRLLEESGPGALTLREVARRAGVTQAAPYHHFADKDALLAAIAEEGFVSLAEAMDRARDAARPKAAARLHAMGEAYVHFAVAHPSHFQIMFVRAVDIPRFPSLHAAADRAFRALLDAVIAGQETGAVRPGDPRDLSILAWSAVHGLAMLWIEGAVVGPADPATTIDHLAKLVADMLLRGLA
jgi:AcrR family transcriptional regulator